MRRDYSSLTATSLPGVEDVWGCSYSEACYPGCAAGSRIQTLRTTDPVWGSITYRRLTTFNGDEVGSPGTTRCELGRNESRHGEGNFNGTFKLYKQGDHYITSWLQRLPSNLNLSRYNWQLIMQMKPTQPYARGCNKGPAGPNCAQGSWPGLEVNSADGTPKWWVLGYPTTDAPHGYLWSQPAQHNVWTSIVFDVVYSTNPAVGYVRVAINNVWSPYFYGQTLAKAGVASPLYKVGDPIPAHLRMGLYHSAAYACPSGCSSEFANVKVAR